MEVFLLCCQQHHLQFSGDAIILLLTLVYLGPLRQTRANGSSKPIREFCWWCSCRTDNVTTSSSAKLQ
jgi:hypothetical protein